jgi:GAF domain-containing protein
MNSPATVPTGEVPMALAPSDLDLLVDASRRGGQPGRIFDAVQTVAAKAIGYKLITIMLFDAERFEVERLYSSIPSVYPLGGRKKKASTAWGAHTLASMKVFRSTTLEGIRQMFDDHETMAGLGIGSILNIPIAYDGRCVGTMNLTHQEGWYQPGHERLGLLIGSFLSTPLALLQSKTLGNSPIEKSI